MGEAKNFELVEGREALISERTRILKELEEHEDVVFFGSNFPGSHEYTEEGYRAAQTNEQLKRELKKKLGEVNEKLGLQKKSRELINLGN